MRVFYYLTNPIYEYRSNGKKKKVPPIKNDLLLISAFDLAEKIRQREVSTIEFNVIFW